MGHVNPYLVLLFVFCTTVFALPKQGVMQEHEKQDKNLVGIASHIVANSLLQGHIDSKNNFVFSPLGFSSILAILKEGSKDKTAKEIENVLHFGSASSDEIRSSYEKSLNYLGDSNPQTSPQFKTWFYVYKPNQLDEEYKSIIQKYYSVDVKEIKRFDFDDELDSSTTSDNDFTYPTSNPYEGLEFPDELSREKKETEHKLVFNKLKLEIQKAENAQAIEKGNSKFDNNVEDKQYAEVLEIKDAMENKEEETIMKDAVKMEEEKKESQVEKEPISLLPEQLSMGEEIMQAMESHIIKKRTRGIIDDDVASALSGNSIVGKKDSEVEDDSENESKMLLFNGLYFRGNWRTPFQQLRTSPSDVFYNSSSEKTQITMMRTRGLYNTGYISSIDSFAVEIPYENDRYSLLIVMPKAHNGVKSLIKQFTMNTLHKIDSEIKEEHLHLTIPKFKVETTGRAEKALAKSGITSLFTRKADLSGITKEQKLHVDELVQHVSVRVDEGSISQNAFSATNLVRSEPIIDEELVIDHPFLFFVRDKVDDIIVVAGKICHVSASKQPVTFFKKYDNKDEKINDKQ